MIFNLSVNDIQSARKEDEIASLRNDQNQIIGVHMSHKNAVQKKIFEGLDTLINFSSSNENHLEVVNEVMVSIMNDLVSLDYFPNEIIEKIINSNICDHLMHFLNPPKSKEMSCIVHDIFKLIYTGSEDSAASTFNSSYFHFVLNYFFDAQNLVYEEFSRIIHSLRFGLQYFSEIDQIFFDKSYQERINQIFEFLSPLMSHQDRIEQNNVEESAQICFHELICLTDSMVCSRPTKPVIFYVTQILSPYLNDPRFSKICIDTFIRCAKLSSEYSNSAKENGLLQCLISIISSPDKYELKARIKSFILVRHILNYDVCLTKKLITVHFCDALSDFVNAKPKHQEMFINSLLQISLNDDSIPIIISQSEVFKIILNLINSSSYKIGIACRLLIASFLRNENTDFSCYIFENGFDYLEDILISDEPEWIIEGLDAIRVFMENVENVNPTIKNQILEKSWVLESLEELCMNSVERIAHTAKYIMNYLVNNDDNTV
ncbi:hypothetical protein TRFO_30295 [Tritrichomonas foetus]|uniref:Uncharacterized protein n=1 Tax=Tritrichomonas foetus TaxID=1144522 RepID=A0A1J4JYE8_9EUKA|nr:hypothetical protein TRFO_30295 [Tritrichomonas foetus]|eukprot:OHT02518.1 hypothetical protein TRFO_30295 [Tritrichomonas foetus]